MSQKKKAVRAAFRAAVFGRDNYKCVICGWNENPDLLDAHHITNRNFMPAGGYVKENGITLCPPCHEDAEMDRISSTVLYIKIGSSYEQALQATY